MAEKTSGRQERRSEVGLQCGFPSIEGEFPDGLIGRRPDARIGDHHIDPPQRFYGSWDQIIRFTLDPQVGADGNSAYLGGESLSCWLRGVVVNGHSSTLGRECRHQSLSDASGAPGNNDPLAR
jgi:hypothetical protein